MHLVYKYVSDTSKLESMLSMSQLLTAESSRKISHTTQFLYTFYSVVFSQEIVKKSMIIDNCKLMNVVINQWSEHVLAMITDMGKLHV